MFVQKAIIEFLHDRERKGCTAGTVTTYTHQLRLFERWLAAQPVTDMERVRERHLIDYLADMRARPNLKWKGTVSPVTIRKRAIGLRTFFLYAKQQKLVKTDPAKHLTIPHGGKRKPKALSPRQVEELLNVDRWRQDGDVLRDYALLVLMLDSGLRLAEVCALNIADVDYERGLVHVRHGKGDKERWTVVTNQTAELLRAYVGARIHLPEAGALPVFIAIRGRRISSLRVYRAVKRRAKQTFLYNEVSPHRLRHTFFTEYLNAGGKLHIAQALGGHENPQTTIGYSSIALIPVQKEHRYYSAVKDAHVSTVTQQLTKSSLA